MSVPVPQCQYAHIHTLKKLFQVVTQLLAHLLQLGVFSQLELMLQPPLSVEIHPVVHPAIGLRCAPNGVVNREAKHALLSCLVLCIAETRWKGHVTAQAER